MTLIGLKVACLFAASRITASAAYRCRKMLVKHVINYLQHARPSTTHRTLFLSCHAPFQPLQTPTAITHIVRRCLANAGISAPKGYAAHLFRHAAATHMVRGGASFKQVADVLGHRS